MSMPRKRFPGCDGEDFKCARLLSGRSLRAVAELLRVTDRTVRNWESGRSQVPYAAFKLMRVMTGYGLPDSAWDGWRVCGESLWSPTGREFPAWGMGYLSLVFGMARQFLRDRGLDGRLPIDRAWKIPRAPRGRVTRVTAPGNPREGAACAGPPAPGAEAAPAVSRGGAPLARPFDDECKPSASLIGEQGHTHIHARGVAMRLRAS